MEPFEALTAARQEAAWRLELWTIYQAVADKMSTVTTSPILSNIDNQVSACQHECHPTQASANRGDRLATTSTSSRPVRKESAAFW